MDYQTINFALLVLTFVFVLIISTKVNDHQSSINSTQDKLSSLQSQFPSLEESVLLLVQKFQETQVELEKLILPIYLKIQKEMLILFL